MLKITRLPSNKFGQLGLFRGQFPIFMQVDATFMYRAGLKMLNKFVKQGKGT